MSFFRLSIIKVSKPDYSVKQFIANANYAVRKYCSFVILPKHVVQKMYFGTSLLLLVTCAVLSLYWYLKKSYSFFEQHGIPYIKPSFLFGNMIDVILLRKSFAEGCADLYKTLEPHRFAGIYAGTKPMVLIRDPNLLKDILIKDFAYFSDRGWKVDPSVEPLSNHLFTMQSKSSVIFNILKKGIPNVMLIPQMTIGGASE